ncbi:kelch domain-containing protein [Anaeramoeba flamelloides]|uniref:Kelch domain-containing protein n=1 Tax=Anaeramoeba flamelloides TaxID=1746091 RepID=A0ABQ8X5H9_9EUKA|nr:kelch domain-containing protein [Anaeramoeba flamelloides]
MWKSYSKNSPQPRSACGHVIYNNKLYIFGGLLSREDCDNSMYTFDLATKKWEKLEVTGDVPKERSLPGLILGNDDKLYCYGGFGDYQPVYEMFNDLYCFDLKKNKWTEIELPENSPKMFAHNMMFDSENNLIYTYGGHCVTEGMETFASPLCSEIHCINLKDNTVTKIKPKSEKNPKVRMSASACLLDGHIFIYGGGTGYTGLEDTLDDMWKFEIESSKWEQIEFTGDSPRKNRASNFVSFNWDSKPKLMSFGGIYEKRGEIAINNDFYIYDLQDSVWEKVGLTMKDIRKNKAPYPRYSHASFLFTDEEEQIWFGLYGGWAGRWDSFLGDTKLIPLKTIMEMERVVMKTEKEKEEEIEEELKEMKKKKTKKEKK